MRTNSIVTGAGVVAACLTALLVSPPAHAQDFSIHVEPAAAFWADKPQSDRFLPGFYVAARPNVSIGPILSVQWSYAMLIAPNNAEQFTEDGSAHFLMAGIRLNPLATVVGDPEDRLDGLWLDGNAGYVRTGDEDRFGFDAGLGYNFQVTPWFALGPVARYGQIVQRDDIPGVDPNDAQWISAGLNMTFGVPRKAVVEAEPAPCPDLDCIPVTVYEKPITPAAATGCSDRDRDGTCDDQDRCPTKIGPPATLGCPIDPCSGEPLVVLVQFPYDSAALPKLHPEDPQPMDPVLDAVAEAIAQDRSCRVCIMGHASEEGPVPYNLELSTRRAQAVNDYLVAHGLADRKMPVTGMGVACQLVPEQSRPDNRRVEFIRLTEGQSCPTTCTP